MPKKNSIGARLKQIKSAYKNRHPVSGWLYNDAAVLRRKYEKITLLGLFVSDENTFLLRPHVFNADKGRTHLEWHDYLDEHYGEILRTRILPGMAERTEKMWRLYRVVGVLPNDNTGLIRAKAHIPRNKTKPQGRANGRNRTRRR